MVKILELRKEKARLLGFRDFADLVLDDRMAHTGERAQNSCEDLREKTERRFREENQELEAFAGRKLEPGTSATGPKSSAPLCMISMKKLCARTFRWIAWCRGCSRSSAAFSASG